MLEEAASDYSAYFKVDVLSGFQTVQDVIDNILMRLEELTSVLQMVKLKNADCSTTVRGDISKYRAEIASLSKKIATLNNVILTLHTNMDSLERQVEKAEIDFGVSNDNKITSFLKPFLLRNKSASPEAKALITPPNKVNFLSVLDNFEKE